MPRPETPLDPAGGALAEFAADLRKLRSSAGNPGYRELSQRAHYSANTLSEAARGQKLPSLAVTTAYVEACGGDVAEWERRWRLLSNQLTESIQQADELLGKRSPYVGLAAFQPDDAEWFFGREQLTTDLLDLVAEHRFVTVFGSSGSGKSSLVMAGLVHHFRQAEPAGRPVLIMTPGSRPLVECATGLAELAGTPVGTLLADLTDDPRALHPVIRQILANRTADSEFLLVVDQFEEVFTLAENERERIRFIGALLTAAGAEHSRVRVVLAVRADFYSHCTQYPGLVEHMRTAQIPVGPMSADELRRAIVRPALNVGCAVENGLLATLVAEATGRTGALPLVSHALLAAWGRRRGNTVTLAGYEAVGGVAGALAQTAEDVYETLTDEQRQLARDLFLRLVARGDTTEDTKRRIDTSEVDIHRSDVRELVDKFAAARLLTVGVQTVELAHEALIRAWPRLREWLNEDLELAQLRRKLTAAADEWTAHGRDDALLFHGARLMAWDGRPMERLNTVEREFLTSGRLRESHARIARRRKVRLVWTAVGVVLAMISALAVFALNQADRAADQRDLAQSGQLVANATAQLDLDPEQSLLLALEAHRIRPTLEVEAVLRQAVVDARLRRTLGNAKTPMNSVAVSRDGRSIAAAGGDGVVRVWLVGAGDDPKLFETGQVSVSDVAFSPDERHVAASSRDGAVRFWRLDGGPEPTKQLSSVADGADSIAFSPDGRHVVGIGSDGAVRLWSVQGDSEPVTLATGTEYASDVAFSPDGREVAIAGRSHTVRLWDVASRTTRRTLPGAAEWTVSVVYDASGQKLVGNGSDGSVRVWDLRDEKRDPVVLAGSSDYMNAVAISPDGVQVAAAGVDSTIHVWSVDGDADRTVLRGHLGRVTDLAFTPDGRQVVSTGVDGTVRMWQAFDGRKLGCSRSDRETMEPVVSPDGRRVAHVSLDGLIELCALDSGMTTVLEQNTHPMSQAVFSPDGQRVAASGPDMVIRVWPVDGGPPLRLPKTEAYVGIMAFTPDGQSIVAAQSNAVVIVIPLRGGVAKPLLFNDLSIPYRRFPLSPDGCHFAGVDNNTGALRVWDLTAPTATPLTLGGPAGSISDLVFSPDGQQVATAGDDGTIRVWPLNGAGPRVLIGHQGSAHSVAFSPDGRWIVSSGQDRTVRLWDWRASTKPITYEGFGAAIANVRFVANGTTLAIARVTGTVDVRPCDICGTIEEVIALARR